MKLEYFTLGTVLTGIFNWSSVAASHLRSCGLRGASLKNYTNNDVFDVGKEGRRRTQLGLLAQRPVNFFDERRNLQDKERMRLRQHKDITSTIIIESGKSGKSKKTDDKKTDDKKTDDKKTDDKKTDDKKKDDKKNDDKKTVGKASKTKGSKSKAATCNDDDKCTVDTYDASEGKCAFTPIICGEGGVCDPSNGICSVLMCHIPPGDPSTCNTISIDENAVAEHLDNGDLLGDCAPTCESFCVLDGATSCPDDALNKCSCCGCETEVSCFEGERVECANAMISVCHLHEDNTYAAVCMAEVNAPTHLSSNENDYYGKCEEDIFIEKSVLRDIPPAKGIEDHDLYDIDYDVTYNEDGIIVLANSYDIIDGVICAPGSVDILFSMPLASQSLASMFPEGAILVVDGNAFDTKCDVYPVRERNKWERTMNVGFLVIRASRVDGTIVTVTGSATILDAIFEEQSMQYQTHPTATGNGTRRELRPLFEDKITVPPEGPLQFVTSAAISGSANLGDFKITSRWIRQEGWLPVYLPEFEWAGELSYHMTAQFTNTLKIKLFKVKFPLLEWEPIDPVGIPGVSIAFPSMITKVLKIEAFEPRAGLVVALPVTMSAELESSINIDFKSSVNFDLGTTRVKVGLSYKPTRLIPLLPIYKTLASEKPHRIEEDQPEQDDESPLPVSSTLSLTIEIGLEPQIRLDVINLAWIGVGTFIGFESFSALRRGNPYPPTEGSNIVCGNCHHIESDGGLVVKDLFMQYKPFEFGGAKPVKETLVGGYVKWMLYKFCLAQSLEGFHTCGNSCCAPAESCENSRLPPTCQNAVCLSECCNDDQCTAPMMCNKEKGQCECSHECCRDSDCPAAMPGKDTCDMASHKCTNEDHVVDKDPFRIVHIGDSYSAGTGTGQYAGPSGCYRSDQNWGRLYSASLDKHIAVRYINRACNGAVMENYFSKRSRPISSSSSPCRSSIQDEVLDDDGVTCKHYVQAQYKAISSDVDLVLMTFGGNDLNFAEIVEQCFVLGVRDKKECEENVVAAETYITSGEFKTNLVKVLRHIAQQLKKPNAKVVLSAYPHLLMDKEYTLGLGIFEPKYDAGTAIRDLALFVDVTQQAAVDAANTLEGRKFAFYFDKTKDVFAKDPGHEPDPSTDTRNPYRWINEFFEPSVDWNEWYHPNVHGHEEWANALSKYGTFDAVEGGQENNGANNIDLAFVIDTTGSMSGDISSVKAEMGSIVDQISNTFQSYRVSIVTYQDFSGSDYPSKVDLDFTDDYDVIQAGIDGLTLGDGGDPEETVLSGLNAALDLEWRAGVSKVTILIGDAPAKVDSEGKEPISGITAAQIIAKSKALDPVQIMAVNLDSLLYHPAVSTIVDGTGGSIEGGTGRVVAAIEKILGKVSEQPFAWFGENIVARVGHPAVFDARGSFDPLGRNISSYEWDFDGDDIYDELTDTSTTVHIYNEPFEGYVLLRVTSDGGVGFASARVVVNEEGSVSQLSDEYCDWDATSGLPILQDEEGNELNCIINGTMWPTIDRPGVFEDNSAVIDACLEMLGSPVHRLLPCEVQGKMRIIHRQTETGDYYKACDAIGDMNVIENLDACVTMCQVLL